MNEQNYSQLLIKGPFPYDSKQSLPNFIQALASSHRKEFVSALYPHFDDEISCLLQLKSFA